MNPFRRRQGDGRVGQVLQAAYLGEDAGSGTAFSESDQRNQLMTWNFSRMNFCVTFKIEGDKVNANIKAMTAARSSRPAMMRMTTTRRRALAVFALRGDLEGIEERLVYDRGHD